MTLYISIYIDFWAAELIGIIEDREECTFMSKAENQQNNFDFHIGSEYLGFLGSLL